MQSTRKCLASMLHLWAVTIQVSASEHEFYHHRSVQAEPLDAAKLSGIDEFCNRPGIACGGSALDGSQEVGGRISTPIGSCDES